MMGSIKDRNGIDLTEAEDIKNCHMTQQSHGWAYTPRKPELKETRVPQCSLQQDIGCLGLVHWVDPEGWYGEGGGRGVQNWEHVYTCVRFMLMYGKTIQKNIVK